ncbi:MAG: fasciclin domain-containing protein [Prevotellaceae bacterium]|nr:fasciclin domain-containing protein [Prevotellaceae bacterium]
MLSLSLLLFACTDKLSEHYEAPSWLKGNAWEVLKNDGNYSLFLAGAERAGFRQLLEGKAIVTVMAPKDDVFNAYLRSHNYSGVDNMDLAELQKLIGFHLLYYTYNKGQMANYRPHGDGESAEDGDVNKGMYYKFRSRSANAAAIEDGHMVYHFERFVPVFSSYFFDTKHIDAKRNYEYFYPNSTWTGEGGGFNVSNASVNEYAILADNGYIYDIDRVLEPLETIATVMKSNPNYSMFYSLYDSYRQYVYDSQLSKDFGAALGADSLFYVTNGDALPRIEVEWPVPNYRLISSLMSQSYSVLAPSNQALAAFYASYWQKGGYQSLTDIDPLVMNYLLLQYASAGEMIFPEEIANGTAVNSFKNPYNVDAWSLTDKAMCVNGNFYGINSMDTPPLFASVVGPAFQYKKYAYYLYVLHGSGLINSLASNDADFVTLIPSNTQFEDEGIYLNEVAGEPTLQKEGESGWEDVSSTEDVSIVTMHTANGVASLKSSGTQIVPTQSAFNYWYIKDGTICSSADFTQYANPAYTGNPFVSFKEISNDTPWNNGKSYEYESSVLFRAENSDGLQYALGSNNDSKYTYYLFAQLLDKAGLRMNNSIISLYGRFIAFIPTNEAVKSGLEAGTIPGITATVNPDGTLGAATVTDQDLLRNYVNAYFITSSGNLFTVYPYPGSDFKSGTYVTAGDNHLIYTDNGTGMSVQIEGRATVGKVISEYAYFPFAYSDGCFHFIDATL